MAAVTRQRGWSFSGLLTFLFIGGIVLSLIFKLGPAYADYETLKSIMKDTVADGELLAKSNYDIKLSLIKKMGINNLKLPEDFVTIERDKGTVHLDVHYEIRVPLVYNVDAVMTFKERFSGRERD